MPPRRAGKRTEGGEAPQARRAPEADGFDPEHIVAEPIKGAAQGLGAALAGAVSALLPLLGNLFREDGRLSLPTLVGVTVFALLIGWAILQAMGRARQRPVFWEATPRGLTVHMDNIGFLGWDQIRAVRAVTIGPGWLTGNPVVALEVHPWMPMDIRRRMKPDPDVKFLVRAPAMAADERFLRLPVWQTGIREHGTEIAARLEAWHTGSV